MNTETDVWTPFYDAMKNDSTASFELFKQRVKSNDINLNEIKNDNGWLPIQVAKHAVEAKGYIDIGSGEPALIVNEDAAEDMVNLLLELGAKNVDVPYIERDSTLGYEDVSNGGRRRKSRKSRLNVQRRRTQRNGRGRKHRKLRKLATRRR